MMTSNAVVTDEKGAFKVISRVKLSLIFLSTVLSLSKVSLFWIWRLLYEREIIKKKKKKKRTTLLEMNPQEYPLLEI